MQKSALQNVCFSLGSGVKKAERNENGRKFLETVGLLDKAGSYPAKLSGGQKQRVSIARALAAGPKILLCDEPTSALDPESTRVVLELIKKINKKYGITVIIITHEIGVVEEICERVAVIDDGKIAECDFVRKIFSNPASIAAKKLVYPQNPASFGKPDIRRFRVAFNGENVSLPIIANMILKFNSPVNIVHADTQNIEGKVFGQRILEFSENSQICEKMLGYLRNNNLSVEEVDGG
jgi:D-methionine transport system ATP-binding protein